MAFGTIFTLDVDAAGRTTIADLGEGNVWENLDAYFAAHNLLFNQASTMIAERTTDRQRRFGGISDMVAQELDEFGQPSAQKPSVPGYNIGFPLRRFGMALQWTRFAFENMTVEEFQTKINGITDADEQALYREIRRALFTPTNYTFTDWQQMPSLDLAVKALLNADGEYIPVNPYGVSFTAGSHTHYSGVTTANTPTQANFVALIENVIEHSLSGNVVVGINRAEEAKVLAFADFKPYVDARLINQTAGIVARGTLDTRNLNDRAIGLLHGAEVRVMPWVPAGYAIAFLEGTNVAPPLVLRQPIPEAARDLRLVADDENYPLRAREWEHRFGVSVFNRANAAVLDMVTGSSTYTAPSL